MEPYEYSNEQFENADNCVNCKEPEYCPPDCNQCCPPPPTSRQQTQPCQPSNNDSCMIDYAQYMAQQKQPNYEPCCAPQSYQTQQQQQQQRECEPCVTNCDPCDPCVERCNPCEPLGPCQMPCDDDCQPRLPCPPLETCSPMCSPYRRRNYVQPPRRESFKPLLRYQRPSIPMTNDTIYKKSFDFIDSETAASCRLPPVRPVGQLQSPCGDFAKETVTKVWKLNFIAEQFWRFFSQLSFQPFCCPERTKPIYPYSRSLLGEGPMQALTTQKHDFVPKFQYRQSKITPRNNIQRSCGCVEKTTVQRLSFMKPDMCNFSKAESCKPVICYQPPETPMEFETTQKLSFMPVCPSPKDDMPWAQKAKYCPPSIRFARDTIAKLSYQPPGCFLDDNAFCCESKCDNMPRASCWSVNIFGWNLIKNKTEIEKYVWKELIDLIFNSSIYKKS